MYNFITWIGIFVFNALIFHVILELSLKLFLSINSKMTLIIRIECLNIFLYNTIDYCQNETVLS